MTGEEFLTGRVPLFRGHRELRLRTAPGKHEKYRKRRLINRGFILIKMTGDEFLTARVALCPGHRELCHFTLSPCQANHFAPKNKRKMPQTPQNANAKLLIQLSDLQSGLDGTLDEALRSLRLLEDTESRARAPAPGCDELKLAIILRCRGWATGRVEEFG